MLTVPAGKRRGKHIPKARASAVIKSKKPPFGCGLAAPRGPARRGAVTAKARQLLAHRGLFLCAAFHSVHPALKKKSRTNTACANRQTQTTNEPGQAGQVFKRCPYGKGRTPGRVNGKSHYGVAGRCGVQSSLYQRATLSAKGYQAMHKGRPYGGARKQKGIPVKWPRLQSRARVACGRCK